MDFLGIEASEVTFRGCQGLPYSLQPRSAVTNLGFVLTYPSNIDHSLAPVVHELVHVYQIKSAGNLQTLTGRYESRRLELGADFIAGIVFAQVLSGANLGDFQHNLSLIGLFYELDERAHGTPSQRTAAFRRGVHLKFSDHGASLKVVADLFQTDHYGYVIRH